MKRKLFEQVFIKSESDLPKEAGYYDVVDKAKKYGHIKYNHSHADDKYWLSEVDWYLIELEQEQSDKSAEEIINGLGNIITGIQSDIDFNEKSNLGLIMDGLTVILEQVEEYAQFKSVPDKGVTDEKPLTEEEAQKCYPDLCFCKHSTYTKGVCDKCGKSED